MTSFLTGAGCIGLIPAYIASYVLNAWAIIKLWGWFIYPNYGLPVPGKATALGIALLVGLMTHQYQVTPETPNKKPLDSLVDAYAHLLFNPVGTVLAGYIIRQWLGGR